jgi:hypothetical protein
VPAWGKQFFLINSFQYLDSSRLWVYAWKVWDDGYWRYIGTTQKHALKSAVASADIRPRISWNLPISNRFNTTYHSILIQNREFFLLVFFLTRIGFLHMRHTNIHFRVNRDPKSIVFKSVVTFFRSTSSEFSKSWKRFPNVLCHLWELWWFLVASVAHFVEIILHNFEIFRHSSQFQVRYTCLCQQTV